MVDQMIRTPREWDEPCRGCHGTGKVHRRERFSLMTPDEYAAGMPAKYVPAKLDTKHDVPDNAIICTPHAGASIFEACKEGVALARAFARPVAFEFNGVVAVCLYGSDPENVSKRWWERAYGKTNEESMRDR
jgi:hypothetical protein